MGWTVDKDGLERTEQLGHFMDFGMGMFMGM